MRGIAAALVAPLFGAYLYGVLLLTILALKGPVPPFFEALFGIAAGALLITLFGSLLAYLGMVFIGLPSWFVLRRFRLEGALPYAACGFFGGFLLPVMKVRISQFGEPLALHNAIAGALVMLVFWWLARDYRAEPADAEA
jgi:hypothetical protein